MDFRFLHLDRLLWIWVILAVIALMIVAAIRRRRALARFADAALIARLVPASGGRGWWRRVLVGLGMLFLLAALLDPRWGVSFRKVPARGLDIIVLLDVSRSMLAEDASPNRLERAKEEIRELLDALAGERIGLVGFAQGPKILCPLTLDHRAFRLALDDAAPESVAYGGSRLGDALSGAADAFPGEGADGKLIIMFTDGEDHDTDLAGAARALASERAIPVATIGLGDAVDGARIPIGRGGQRVYLTHDQEEVWSKLNEPLLREVALTTGGVYVPAGIDRVDMATVYDSFIRPLGADDDEATERRVLRARYQWFAGIAFALLLTEAFIGVATRNQDLEETT